MISSKLKKVHGTENGSNRIIEKLYLITGGGGGGRGSNSMKYELLPWDRLVSSDPT